MISSKKWVCRGIPKDEEEYPVVKIHPPHKNYAPKCEVCGLPREASAKGKSPIPTFWIVGVGIITGVTLLTSVGLFKLIVQSCSTGEVEVDGVCQVSEAFTSRQSVPVVRDYSWETTRFSWGQRALFSGEINVPKNKGIKLFQQGKYAEAASFFKRAIAGNRNDPEVVILYNNALAHMRGNPFSLATVVPVDNNQQSAKEILRGVAQAQAEFNQKGGLQNRLLEIVIANDGNEPENSAKVAEQLVADKSILGVIGHNSSNASQAGLKVYEKGKLPMISPTSTSTSLRSNYFFRTSPSDAASGVKLAQYVFEQLQIDKAVIFYNPDSSYSSSLKMAFQNQFEEIGGKSTAENIADVNLEPRVAIANSIIKEKAQVGLLFADTEYISVAIELARANANLPSSKRLKLLSGDSLYSSDTLAAGGESIENLVLAVPWFVGAAKSPIFSQTAENKWGGSVNWRTAMSFDAAQSFIKALENANSRRAILQNLTNLKLEVDETSGEGLAFTNQGERQSEPILIQVTQGGVRPSNSKYGYTMIE